MSQFIFTMKGLGKIYPPDSVVFQDIWLSFLYGAKIGVIGSNGSGKSTLLRIMAGIDTAFLGEARLSAGYTVGLLPQEPVLDATKNVLGNVEEGVAPIRALLTTASTRSMRSSARRCPTRTWTSCSPTRRACRTPSRRRAPGTWIPSSNTRWTRCVCRRATPT